jgi:hypothetical protein
VMDRACRRMVVGTATCSATGSGGTGTAVGSWQHWQQQRSAALQLLEQMELVEIDLDEQHTVGSLQSKLMQNLSDARPRNAQPGTRPGQSLHCYWFQQRGQRLLKVPAWSLLSFQQLQTVMLAIMSMMTMRRVTCTAHGAKAGMAAAGGIEAAPTPRQTNWTKNSRRLHTTLGLHARKKTSRTTPQSVVALCRLVVAVDGAVEAVGGGGDDSRIQRAHK